MAHDLRRPPAAVGSMNRSSAASSRFATRSCDVSTLPVRITRGRFRTFSRLASARPSRSPARSSSARTASSRPARAPSSARPCGSPTAAVPGPSAAALRPRAQPDATVSRQPCCPHRQSAPSTSTFTCPELGADAVRAAMQAAAEQQPHADGVLRGDDREIREILCAAEPAFGKRREVRIVLELGRKAKPALDHGGEIHHRVAEDRAPVRAPGGCIDHPGDPDPEPA